jgi:hypothetical protein
LETPEFLFALVELVVAYAVDLEAEAIRDLDGGLVVEEGREERARAGKVAGGDDDVAWILALEPGDVTGEVIHAADGDGWGLGTGRIVARRLKISVEIVERDDLQVKLLRARATRSDKTEGDSESDPAQMRGLLLTV